MKKFTLEVFYALRCLGKTLLKFPTNSFQKNNFTNLSVHFLMLAVLVSGTFSLTQAQGNVGKMTGENLETKTELSLGAITGSVADSNGNAIVGATVTVTNMSTEIKRTANVNEFGNYVISNLDVGNYTVVGSAYGFEDKKIDNVEVLDASASEIKLILSLRGSVKEEVEVTAENEEAYESVKGDEAIDESIIDGLRKNSEARALIIQKKSMSIMNVIAADGIGKLPDRNAAETVQRIQGVSIERDQGEGRFVSVRGLPPFWSSTTINGNRLPTAEEETTSRATAFDFFPSELIAYVQAAKAYTPDMEVDGIGGGVNFITKTAPVRRALNANIVVGYNNKSSKPVYNVSSTYGNKSRESKFGFILNGSYWNRNWATDNFEARRKGDEGVFRMEFRDYTGIRTTTGLNGAMEYNFTNEHKIYFRSIYGTLSDTETHYKKRVRFDKFNPSNNTARVELQNIYNELITEMIGGDIGGKHTLGSSKVNWSLSTYHNEFKYGDIPTKADNSYFAVKFNQDGVGIKPEYLQNRPKLNGGAGGHRAYWKADGGLLDYNDTDALFGFFRNPSFKTDAQKLKFADLELYKISVKERDNIVFFLNYEQNVNDNFTFKLGTKYRNKDRRAEFEDLFYGWKGANSPYLSNYSQYILSEQPGRAGYLKEISSTIQNNFGPVLSTEGMINFWNNNRNNLEILPSDSLALRFNSGLGRNFDVDETHFSFYGMGTLKTYNKLTILGGLRTTRTKTMVNGYVVEDGSLKRAASTKQYWAILPMVHIKYSPRDKLNIRFAATRSFSRPNFGDISPSGTFISFDNEFKGGNPNLNPTYSWNFDLLGEYYFDNIGIVNAGVFYKSITGPVFNDTYQGAYNGIRGVEFSTPTNGADAWISGVELGINKRLDFLPGFLKYLGTQLNATFMDSEMTKPSGRKVSTPYQASALFNAQLYFEKGRFSSRIAFNQKGEYAIGFGERDIDDLYYGKYNTLDFSTSYRINRNWTIYSDVNNILNNPLIYHYGKTEDRPKQVEYYGLRFNIGIKYNL